MRHTISNEKAFARYRDFVESDVKNRPPLLDIPFGFGLPLQIFAAWKGRYRRRRDRIEGGRDYSDSLADVLGRERLMARNLAMDAQFPDVPDWDVETRRMIDLSLKNYAEPALDAPHPFGPSVRRLWSEAKSQGRMSQEAWKFVYEWAYHLPPAFAVEQARNQGGEGILGTEHGRLLTRIEWEEHGEARTVWRAEVEGAQWQVVLQDFPDEPMYALRIGDQRVGSFHDWPACWGRPGQAAQRTQSQAKPSRRSPKPEVPKGAHRWLARYEAGEREQVWAEMEALGPAVRDPMLLPHAEAVARETMRRAHTNIESLIGKLGQLGYRFWQPRPWQRPEEEEVAAWVQLEGEGLLLPLSLRAWIQEVGVVDLTGSHPMLAAMEGEPHFHGCLADPLMVAPHAGWTAETWEAARESGEAVIELVMGWDDVGKSGLAIDAPVEDPYTIRVPNSGSDAPVDHAWHHRSFVSHLRAAFHWGGFPGWERYPERPDRELALLREGLLPL